jgi:Co/Zn/Cd efflux system component
MAVMSIVTSMRVEWLIISACSLWVSFVYLRLLAPSHHNENHLLAAVLFGSSAIALCFAVFIEKVRFDLSVWRAAVGGIFVWFSPTVLLLLKTNVIESRRAVWCFVLPFCVALLGPAHTPPGVFLGFAMGCIGTTFLSASISEKVTIKPFATGRSAAHFFMTIVAFCGAVLQYFRGYQSGQLWRMIDSIYFIVVLKWTLSEVLNAIQQSPTIKFSYGYRRISHLFGFSLAIFALLSLLGMTVHFFSPMPLKKSNAYDAVVLHVLMVGFFFCCPRNSKQRRSVIGAVNFNVASEMQDENFQPFQRDILDAVALLLSLVGGFIHSFLFDRVLALLAAVVVLCLSIPMLVESIAVLMQVVPKTVAAEGVRSQLSRELCDFHVWHNDDALAVGTVRMRIDPQKCPRPQDFLMKVILRCQQAGILDVTAEMTTGDLSQSVPKPTWPPRFRYPV